ncbi:MAG TPA: DUF922 domain-containing protein [Fimbriimonadaceae bacterium]|nr:DUF922 domain-containing protein [Fimbriimonadaceae bacterium]
MPILACYALLVMAQQGQQPRSFADKAEEARGYIPYRALTWDDFHTNDVDGTYLADTEAFIHYDFRAKYVQSGSSYVASVTSIEIRSGFDATKSWRKSKFNVDPDVLLRHEQGHLDINETYARKLRKTKLSEWPTGSGPTAASAEHALEDRIRTLFAQAIANCQAEQNQYDDETKHGQVASSQQTWLAKIKHDFDAAK